MGRKSTRPVWVLALLLLLVQRASADVVYFSSQSAFESQGTIQSRVDFDSYGASGGTISTNSDINGLQFQTSPYTVVIGTGNTSYHTQRDVAVSPYLGMMIYGLDTSPTPFSMLGFQLGYVSAYNGGYAVNIYITTNKGSYNMGNYAAPATNSSLAFEGFATTLPGEYITQVQIGGTYNPNGGGAGVTAFEFGQLSSVPEPSGLLMGIWGIAAAVMAGGRRRIGGR